MDDVNEQMALRDRLRRELWRRKTPQQRMRDMARLQESMWATLRRSPDGYAHFLRRNFKARAVLVQGAYREGAKTRSCAKSE
jgi:ribosomal protein L32E